MAVEKNIPDWLVTRPIAHRGLHDNGLTPENSLTAFQAAICAGAPIEMDVRLLSDRQPVVFHDRDMFRMTGVKGNIEERDSKDIQTLRLLDTKQTIPLLADALYAIDGAVPIIIEIKSAWSGAGDLERSVLQALQNYNGAFAIQSFNPMCIHYFRKNAPSICRGQLSTGPLGVPFAWWSRPDFVAYNINSLSSGFAARLRRSGAALLAWTVTNAKQCAAATAFADNYIFEAGPEFLPFSLQPHLDRQNVTRRAKIACSWLS